MAANCNIIDFFDKEIDKKEFAKVVRRLLNATITLQLTDKESDFTEWVSDGYYRLNQFVEVLDPQLND